MTIEIGIDPDVDKSGIAAWDSKSKKFTLVSSMRIFSLFSAIDLLNRKHKSDICVVVEAGYLNKKANHHNQPRQSKAAGEKIAKNVGRNEQVGRIIVEYCAVNDIQVVEAKPLKKTWGKDGKSKINKDEFKRISGWGKVTNQESRDAGLMVLGR